MEEKTVQVVVREETVMDYEVTADAAVVDVFHGNEHPVEPGQVDVRRALSVRPSRVYPMAKRFLDVTLSLTGLIVAIPLMAGIAAAVKLTSKGPVFYRSRRWGRFGSQIQILKFRTMVTEAADMLKRNGDLDSRYAENVKLVSDPRVTRLGRWLRRWSLDELPQLYNVLTGHMSLVGPRPKLIGENTRYGQAMAAVLAVPPGLTGLWQVSGRSNINYQQRITMDLDYVTRRSLWLDLAILVRTIPTVATGHGAY
jgi:lipopolysaccharide/colanic/teichoic acid biosynthesis glycosyltransferase